MYGADCGASNTLGCILQEDGDTQTNKKIGTRKIGGRKMKRFLMNEEGQGMVEYGLILALVAVVVIGALTLLGGGITAIFGKVTDELN